MTECMKSELDIFEKREIQTNILDNHEVSYKPLASVDNQQLEFIIPGHSEFYRDLASVKLRIRAKLVKIDGGAVTEADGVKITGVNNLLHSMFSQCSVYLNGVSVTSTEDNYHYRAYIETLLYYGRDAAETHLTNNLWYVDTPTTDDHSLNGKPGNKGYEKRLALVNNGSEFELIGPIHADIFNLSKLLINNVEIRIKMIKSADSFFLYGPDKDSKVTLKITDATLYMKNVQISPSVLIAHARTLSHSRAIYNITRVDLKTFTIPQGSRSISINNMLIGQIPRRVIFAMVDNDAFAGTFDTNPFSFKHYSMSTFSSYIDGVRKPAEEIACSFGGDRQNTMAYQTLFTGMGIHHQNNGHLITSEMYAHGFFLLSFDYTPDASADENHSSLVSHGTVAYEIRFSKPLSTTVTCLVFAEYDANIEIDHQRNVYFEH